MILHIPHASALIPGRFSNQFMLSGKERAAEQRLITDAHTDELFAFPKGVSIRFPYSRLLVDVERFADDTQEPMSRVGMGRVQESSPLKNARSRPMLA